MTTRTLDEDLAYWRTAMQRAAKAEALARNRIQYCLEQINKIKRRHYEENCA